MKSYNSKQDQWIIYKLYYEEENPLLADQDDLLPIDVQADIRERIETEKFPIKIFDLVKYYSYIDEDVIPFFLLEGYVIVHTDPITIEEYKP